MKYIALFLLSINLFTILIRAAELTEQEKIELYRRMYNAPFFKYIPSGNQEEQIYIIQKTDIDNNFVKQLPH